MIIKQEETSPVSDYFDKKQINTAFNLINSAACETNVDSDSLKVWCNETVKLLNDFVKYIEKLERENHTKNARDSFMDKLYGNKAIDD